MRSAEPRPLLSNRAELKQRVQRAGLRLTRKRGQSFLVNERELDFIVAAAELTPEDRVLEIGSGPGNLTSKLAQTGARVLACEIDPGLAALASEALDDMANVQCVVCDALDGSGRLSQRLREELDKFLPRSSPLKVVSNLPYCISTPAITALVESTLPWDRFVLTVQKEVADRLIAAPGVKAYSYLSARVQLQCETQLLKTISPRAFWPQPEVRSTVVRIMPRPGGQRIDADSLMGFKRIAKAIFSSRRKTMLNSLHGCQSIHLGRDEITSKLRAWGIEPTARGERLAPLEMLELAQFLES